MRVLVTGGAGFIGAHLASSLADSGHHVDIADNFVRGVRDPFLDAVLARGGGRVRLLTIDLLAADALDVIEGAYHQVFHLAAIVGVRHVLSRPYDVLWQNVEMTGRVLAFARRQASLARLVFASTSEVYAGTLQHGTLPIPTPETAPLVVPELTHARTSYMLSKIYGEAMCHASGLPVTIVRPHNVYGPRMGLSHVIPELLKRAHEAPDDSALEVFSPDHRRTFCFVDDAVVQMRGAADSPDGVGATVNVGSDSPECTIEELAELVVKTVGRRLRVTPGPTTSGSPTRRCPDTTRVNGLTGRHACVPLDEGIARTYAWYKEAVFVPGGTSAL